MPYICVVERDWKGTPMIAFFAAFAAFWREVMTPEFWGEPEAV
jgi:hypothetical protein